MMFCGFQGYVIERIAPAWLSSFWNACSREPCWLTQGKHKLVHLEISQGETHMERNWSLPSQQTATTARVNESSDDSSSQF